jgi:hypothetical protein
LKKLDLGQTVSILANIGVIAGIVFLAIEISQNNELLGAQARASRVALRQADTALVIENPELAAAYFKYTEGEPVTGYEQMLLDQLVNYRLVNYQNVYREMREGLIDLETIPLEAWKADFDSVSDNQVFSLRDFWLRRGRREFDPDFAQWVEENLLDD